MFPLLVFVYVRCTWLDGRVRTLLTTHVGLVSELQIADFWNRCLGLEFAMHIKADGVPMICTAIDLILQQVVHAHKATGHALSCLCVIPLFCCLVPYTLSGTVSAVHLSCGTNSDTVADRCFPLFVDFSSFDCCCLSMAGWGLSCQRIVFLDCAWCLAPACCFAWCSIRCGMNLCWFCHWVHKHFGYPLLVTEVVGVG